MRDTSRRRTEPGRYEIRTQGHLDPRWATWFDGLSLTQDGDGTTVLHGALLDQAALYGVLLKLRDLGLPLLSVTPVTPVTPVEPDRPTAPEAPATDSH